MIFTLAYLVLETLASYFENLDDDKYGNDDRAARIIRNAITELKIWEEEKKALNS